MRDSGIVAAFHRVLMGRAFARCQLDCVQLDVVLGECLQVKGNATLVDLLVLSILFAPWINSEVMNTLIDKRLLLDIFRLEVMVNIPRHEDPRSN